MLNASLGFVSHSVFTAARGLLWKNLRNMESTIECQGREEARPLGGPTFQELYLTLLDHHLTESS